MSERPKILVVRAEGGLGDQICATVAVRAAMEKYGDDFDVHAAVGLKRWRDLFVDQGYCHEYIDCQFARYGREKFEDVYDFVYLLDGPEYRLSNHLEWAPINRTEVWCKSVDHTPDNLCPKWTPKPHEVEWAKQYVADKCGHSSLPLIIIQPRPCMGMPWKHWPNMPQLAEMLANDYRVLVLHDQPLAEYADMRDVVFDCGLDLRQLGSVLSLADLIVAPDSAFVHFAAAVNVKCFGIFGGTSGAVTCRNYRRASWAQAPIDPNWKCATKAPCAGMAIRNFWCNSRDFVNMAACMERLSTSVVLDAITSIV